MNTLGPGESAHKSYPHEYGTLYDCPGCESECFCGPLWNGLLQLRCLYCSSNDVENAHYGGRS